MLPISSINSVVNRGLRKTCHGLPCQGTQMLFIAYDETSTKVSSEYFMSVCWRASPEGLGEKNDMKRWHSCEMNSDFTRQWSASWFVFSLASKKRNSFSGICLSMVIQADQAVTFLGWWKFTWPETKRGYQLPVWKGHSLNYLVAVV